jgi:hypothetical protein
LDGGRTLLAESDRRQYASAEYWHRRISDRCEPDCQHDGGCSDPERLDEFEVSGSAERNPLEVGRFSGSLVGAPADSCSRFYPPSGPTETPTDISIDVPPVSNRASWFQPPYE